MDLWLTDNCDNGYAWAMPKPFLRHVEDMRRLCVAGCELYDGDVRGRTDAYRRAPCARSPRHVQLGVSVPLQPGDGRIGECGKIVARPELAAVGVAGKLEVDAVLDSVVDDDGLMREKHGRPGTVPVAERLPEIGAVALALARDVVDTGEIEGADLDAFVLERLEPELTDVVDPLVGAGEVLVISGHEEGAVARGEPRERLGGGPEVRHAAVDEVPDDGDEVGEVALMVSTIRWVCPRPRIGPR